jgi:hypothetical protein
VQHDVRRDAFNVGHAKNPASNCDTLYFHHMTATHLTNSGPKHDLVLGDCSQAGMFSDMDDTTTMREQLQVQEAALVAQRQRYAPFVYLPVWACDAHTSSTVSRTPITRIEPYSCGATI